MPAKNNLIIIGGSAGSLSVINKLLNALPAPFRLPIVIVLHRQKNVSSEMEKILAAYAPSKKILEPEDKQPVSDCCIYLAPQNYHLLIEQDRTFSLDYSEAVLFSRPSIDVTFESAAKVFKSEAVAILLSGANNDGTVGLEAIISNGGTAIVQDPSTASYSVMPKAASDKNPSAQILSPDKIVSFILSLDS
jgi:two-component system chemotaxis response regulator CheB